MISVNDVSGVSSLLSCVFFYGFSHKYSSETIEKKIISNKHINDLEDGDSSFLIRETTENIIASIFELEINGNELIKTNPLALWLGELYTKIFFSFNKPFSFIFLYLSINKAIEMFPLYHEMDFSQSLLRFEELISKQSILTILLKKKKMSVRELSELTGINANTLTNYTRDNEYIYNAKFDSIYKISRILKVDEKVFIKKINNNTSSSMYQFDKTNVKYRSYLGLYLASYYSSGLKQNEYEYDETNNVLRANKRIIKTMWTSIETVPLLSQRVNKEIIDIVQNYSICVHPQERKNQILIIFEYNQISESVKEYSNELLKYGFDKIFIINSSFIMCINEREWISYISDTVQNEMVNKAKTTVGGDFAI